MTVPRTPLEPWPVDKPLPSVLTATELMQVLGLRKSAFYRHEAAGRFRCLQVPRPIGVKRYSGYLVERYRSGEPLARIGAGSRTKY
jgi:predicted DNA-binding transcriptional regulator AlpA